MESEIEFVEHMSLSLWSRYITRKNMRDNYDVDVDKVIDNSDDAYGEKMEQELIHHLQVLNDDNSPIPGHIAKYVRLLRGQFAVDLMTHVTSSKWSDEFYWQRIWVGDTGDTNMTTNSCLKKECKQQQEGRVFFKAGKTDDVKALLQIITKRHNYCTFCKDSLFYIGDSEFTKSFK
jgi:hypothetical protein